MLSLLIAFIVSIFVIAIFGWIAKKIVGLLFAILGWAIKTALAIVFLPFRLVLSPFFR